ncbi:hypothetical protein E2C01_071052 [Portunus trituberculatus]|uniref:Uncharacterized protein n=1 Tax=Portunus trituberculatus TaxID=210409 RepID=A0A5B7I3B0_PORTR|nr:hypothetical protein [Portunus trituberculatus]
MTTEQKRKNKGKTNMEREEGVADYEHAGHLQPNTEATKFHNEKRSRYTIWVIVKQKFQQQWSPKQEVSCSQWREAQRILVRAVSWSLEDTHKVETPAFWRKI